MAVLARAFFPLIASDFPVHKLDLSVRLFYALLPVVVLSGIAANCTAVLNTFDRFAMPALAPLVMPAVDCRGGGAVARTVGIWALVYGTLFGAVVHAALVAWMMEARGYRFRLRWHGKNEATREVAHQYGPVLLSSVVASGGLLVDQAMAAMLPAGSVSALVFRQPVCERGGDADGGGGVLGGGALFSSMIARRTIGGGAGARCAPGRG